MTSSGPSPVASDSGGSRLLTVLLWIALVVVVTSGVFAVALWPETPPDTSPPTRPGGLTLGEVTCRATSLTWSGSTDDTEVTRYEIFHDGQLITSVDSEQRSTAITLVPATTWSIHVSARDEAGNTSPASDAVAVTPPQCGSDAKAPSTPGGVKAVADGTTVTMTWDAASDDVGIAAYDVYRDGAKTGTVDGVGKAKKFTFIDFGVAPSSGHRYQVGARDGQGNTSPRSAGVDVTAGALCTMLCGVAPVAKETDIIGGLVELPDGSVLYSRRDGHEIVRLDPRTGQGVSLGEVPGAAGTGGDGGLLGIAVAPTFAKDRWIYAYLTTTTDNRVVRLRLNGGVLDAGSMQSLVVGIPRGKFHNGGRLRFGPDGKLYVATGDAQKPQVAQDVRSLGGKVLRFNPDGTPPASNPFGGSYLWSIGHRNPQGITFDGRGRAWIQEYGDGAADETNLIVKGGNYGWPACDGTESKSGDGCEATDLLAPQQTFTAAQGGCLGVAFVRDVVYVACAGSSRLYRADVDGDGALADLQAMLVGTYGQLRTADPGAAGTLWVTSSNTDAAGKTETQILRVTLPTK
ncbi:glucose/arabinose dehydrogenase [Allocatelliglobosispora scoriae]|uniref:Glucose/arabinose dehydrogenase n=1 Tax=Allocatelliglobosispora scoriae TaxID=643052 RepID=A0A841C154_9ACTN|nr:PQQ-dependent sugar dehydrogenase [Allocatelliglobosispora scoriae]MBB5873596.1 glucose/arabinose dehydrogenase [Allocatelliglobosispora scoriae]